MLFPLTKVRWSLKVTILRQNNLLFLLCLKTEFYLFICFCQNRHLFSISSLPLDGLFSWSRAVQIRTNLDLVLDWLQGAGLGDIASEFMKKLSITVNFLCIPKTRLIQVTQQHVQCVL